MGMGENFTEPRPILPLNQETLERHGLEVYGGSCRVEEAKVICLADPNHAADVRHYGAFLREVCGPEDSILIEGYELEQADRYGVEDMGRVASWEDPAVYLLAVLVSMRDSQVARRVDLMFGTKIMALLARQSPEYREAAEKDLKRIAALERAAAALSEAYNHVVLDLRDQILQNQFIAALGRPGRTFVIAGAGHFEPTSFFSDAYAANIPLVGIRPASELPEDPDLLEAYRRSEEKGDRSDIKALCLAALGNRNQTIASLASLRAVPPGS